MLKVFVADTEETVNKIISIRDQLPHLKVASCFLIMFEKYYVYIANIKWIKFIFVKITFDLYATQKLFRRHTYKSSFENSYSCLIIDYLCTKYDPALYLFAGDSPIFG